MRWFLARVSPLRRRSASVECASIGAVVSHMNITDRKLAELDCARLAATDPLTGLSVTDLVGSVQINITGNARFFAGNGGNGFTTGGKGGSISGVVVRTINIDPNDPDSGTVGAVGGISASLVAGC